ncbi:MAG: shufflon system plasmid conjugative transfer pilus tip adhesin PilV, partial [Verrucomicrobia bacterium CG_4_9_14_3_um_filter_43_20]
MNKNQRGFTLLEMALALSVASMGLLAIADYSQKHVEEMKIQVSGDYMTNIGKAAKAYIDDNYNTIVGIASPTTPFELDVSTLIAANYLPAGYSSTDPFGQQIKVLVLEPQANKLNGLVISTGGEQLNDVSLSQYVTQIGADGGGVYSETP